jgi:hypothetical protein
MNVDSLNKKIIIRANNFNIEHLRSIGYNPEMNEYIEIFVYELSPGSGTKIDVECDYCGVIFKKAYRRFLETLGDICCNECKNIKMMKTSLERYGNICSLRNEVVQQKSRDKNQENLGCDYPFQNSDILKKCVDTTIEKYGKSKVLTKTSQQQSLIHSLLGGIINKSIFPYFVDIFFEEEKIYFEYDGSGHEINIKMKNQTREWFDEKELRRESFLFGKGLKEFRIVSKTDNIPSNDILLQIKDRAFDLLLNQNFIKYIYDLDAKTESFEK